MWLTIVVSCFFSSFSSEVRSLYTGVKKNVFFSELLRAMHVRDQAAAGRPWKPCFPASHLCFHGRSHPARWQTVSFPCDTSCHDTASCAGLFAGVLRVSSGEESGRFGQNGRCREPGRHARGTVGPRRFEGELNNSRGGRVASQECC